VYLVASFVLVVAAGALGVYANAAGEGPEYIQRLRILFLGAAALGCLGPTIFVARKAKGRTRACCLPLPLLAARIAYLPCLQGALLLSGWVERLGRAFGALRLGAIAHYSLGCAVAALVCFAAFVLLSAAAHARRPASIAVFVFFGLGGAFALWHEDDRTPLPHAFVEDRQPAAEGKDYLDVSEDVNRSGRARLLGALYGIADALSPRGGWAGAVREDLHARFRADPDMSLRARVTSIEGALRTARPLSRTSPRTPPP
jgi:hypothetical protein